MNEKSRIYAIDNIKSILIFLVVFGHFLLGVASRGDGQAFDIYTLIYCFHMPAFMFISGYLTHETSNEWFKKYITLYAVFNSIYFLIGVLYVGDNLSPLNPAYSMWYILLLIIFRLLTKFVTKKHWLFLLVVSFVAYLIFPLCNFGSFFVHIKFAAFFIYFVLGFISQKLFTTKFYESRKPLEMIIACIICIVSVIVMGSMVKSWNIGFAFVNHATPYANFAMVVLSLFALFLNIIFIYALMYAMPNKKIFIVTTIGQNSLYVYLIHRIITLFIPGIFSDTEWIFFSLIMSIIVCLVVGSNIFISYVNQLMVFFDKQMQAIIGYVLVCVMLLCAASAQSQTEVHLVSDYPEINTSEINDCVKISYVGDMLLFEEDIVRAKANNYDFDSIFKYTKPYFGDYTIGIFEGVVDESQYSVGNYYDNRSLHLRYPYEFAKIVSENVDLVSLGMNHIMDGNMDDVEYTLSTFDKLKLNHVGAYLFQDEADSINIVNIDGLRVAILAYTDSVNYDANLYPYTVKFLDYETVVHDIETAKSLDVDMIFAMPHIGTQFNHGVNDRQKYWNRIFVANGVDVVLADHAHVVEPIEYIDNTVIINCPGNYYTSLSGEDQEYGAICNLYIDKTKKQVVTTSIVPIKSVITPAEGMVVPLYDINDINGTNLVLDNMIGIKVASVLPEYYYSKKGYSLLHDDVTNADFFGDTTVCFIGDSITEGTMNNGHGWYEYVTSNCTSVAKGGATSESILTLMKDNVPDADVYVCAIGCNDIRYADTSADEYLSNIEKMVDMLGVHQNAELYFVSPWYTLPSDGNSELLDYVSRNKAIETYNEVLQSYCDENGYHFVDTYTDLKLFFENCDNDRYYMVDGVHPNSTTGIKLYGNIFMKNAK